MKNRKSTIKTKQKFLECLVEIKKQLDLDPFVKTSKIVQSFRINRSTFHHLKSIGVVSQTNDGHFWIGNEPDWNMVSLIQKRESEYQNEYRERKNSNVFEPKIRSSHKKGKREPKPIQRNLVFDDAIGFDPKSINNWHEKIEQSKQNAVKTNIPIQNNEINDAETEKRLNQLIDLQTKNQKILDETNQKLNEIKSTEQHVEKKSKTFEFRLFGFTFFSINY
jgi:hypothetical protein